MALEAMDWHRIAEQHRLYLLVSDSSAGRIDYLHVSEA